MIEKETIEIGTIEIEMIEIETGSVRRQTNVENRKQNQCLADCLDRRIVVKMMSNPN